MELFAAIRGTQELSRLLDLLQDAELLFGHAADEKNDYSYERAAVEMFDLAWNDVPLVAYEDSGAVEFDRLLTP